MPSSVRVLVTNDDGVAAPGLHALAAAIAELGHDVVVVAPTVDMSGAGASIGRLASVGEIHATPVRLPGAEDVPAFSLPGPPGMCVLAARLGALGPAPDLVVSGINPGCNTGRAVLHSGTVGAALTAANFGVKGLAVSIDMPSSERSARGEHPRWATAAAYGARAVAWMVDSPPGTVLNLNVPDLPAGDVRGVRWATLAPFGTVRTTVVEPVGPQGGRLQMELRPHREELPATSDTALIRRGFATITRLTGIQATDPVDPADIFGADNGANGDRPAAGGARDAAAAGDGDGSDDRDGPDGSDRDAGGFDLEAVPAPAPTSTEPVDAAGPEAGEGP